MIVRVPSYTEDAILHGEYQKLFAAAEKKTGMTITNLPEYFNALQEDANLRGIGRFARIPLDEDLFLVNLNDRSITVPPHFQKYGVAVNGDHLAEFLFFRVDRYFDQMDLSECECRIEWMTAGNKPLAAYTPAHAIDLVFEAPIDPSINPKPAHGDIIYADDSENEEDRENGDRSAIIFGWPLDNQFTSEIGDAKFAIRFVQYNINEEDNTKEIVFNLLTSPATVKILPKLPIDSEMLEMVDYSATLASRPVYSGLINSTGLKPVITSYSWEEKAYENLGENGQVTLSVTATDPDPSKYPLTYQWFKDSKSLLEETQSSYVATEAGLYHVVIMNAVEDEKGKQIGTASIATNPCLIPKAGEIAIDYNSNYPLELFSSGEEAVNNMKIKIIPASEADHNLGKIEYVWTKNGEEDDEGIVSATGDYWEISKNIAEKEHGNFVLTASHLLNKTESAEITGREILVRPAPEQPTNVEIIPNETETIFTCSCVAPNNDDLYYQWAYKRDGGGYTTITDFLPNNSVTKEQILEKVSSINNRDKLTVDVKQIRFNRVASVEGSAAFTFSV